MSMIRQSTKEQLRCVITHVSDAGRRSGDLPSTRRLQQAAALLDAASELIDMVDQFDVIDAA